MSAVDATIARWRAAVPEELWEPRIWLLWKKFPKPNKPGKFDKVPFYADGYQRHGVQGRPEERLRLVEFGEAIAAYAERETFHGIGLALLADVPFWALDLDDCVAADGALSALARHVISSESYVEKSPSGSGVRALFAGKCGCDRKNHGVGVETFDSRGFVTITGDSLGGGEVLPCPPDLLAEILATLQAGSRSIGSGKNSGPSVATAPPENPEAPQDVRLPLALWRRLERPYRDGCDRSREAFVIALQLNRAGLTAEQAFALMARTDCDVLAPALERRSGDIESARAWLWRYCVLPAFQGDSHGR